MNNQMSFMPDRVVSAAVVLLLSLALVSCSLSGGKDSRYDGTGAWFEVTGTVIDEMNQPVAGIRVSYTDSFFGTVTGDSDPEGRFELRGNLIPSSNITLVATDLGDGQNWGDYATVTSVVSLEESGETPGAYYADGVVIYIYRTLGGDW